MIYPDELLFVVDENNNPIPPKSRKDAHLNKDWHRTTDIWVVNAQKQILCQKRSKLKDVNPDKWEAHFGGHVASGQEYIDNAVIETKEEVGIVRKREDMIFFKVYKYEKDKEFQGLFHTLWNGNIGDITLEEEEVEEVAWKTIQELEKIFKEKDPAWIHHGYEQELLTTLKTY